MYEMFAAIYLTGAFSTIGLAVLSYENLKETALNNEVGSLCLDILLTIIVAIWPVFVIGSMIKSFMENLYKR